MKWGCLLKPLCRATCNLTVLTVQDGVVGLHVLRSQELVRSSLASEGPLTVPSITHHASNTHTLYAYAGDSVHQMDMRQVAAFSPSATSCHTG